MRALRLHHLEANPIARGPQVANSLIFNACRVIQPILDRRFLFIGIKGDFAPLAGLKVGKESAIFFEVRVSWAALALGKRFTRQPFKLCHSLPPATFR